jgi:NIPSNAP
MARRFAGTLATLIVGIAIGTTATGMLVAQQPAQPAQAPAGGRGTFGAPAGPCGPQGQLAAEFAKNVDPKARCFEVRQYTVDRARVGTGAFNGSINELHQRFREQEVAIFKKHGAEIVGVWQHLGNPDTLVWMLAYRDRAHREEVWAKFAADPDWKALSSKYSVPINANVFTMSATDYSPLK